MDGFEVLGDPIRRDLVRRLAHGPARVVDLAAGRNVSRPAVSRHLRLLAEAGVVVAEDRGRERHYRLEPVGLAPVRRFLDEVGVAPAARPTPRLPEAALHALDTEVRRTTRERRAAPRPVTQEEAG